MMSYSSNNKLLHHMSSVTHEVDQVLEVDFSSLSEDDRNEIIECHKNPDAYVCDDSFLGEMVCRIEECLVKENSEKPGSFILKRTLYFDFSWEDEDEMSEWEEDNTTTDDANLPSYVVGDYEGVCIGDAMHDYETDYRGITV